MATALSTPQILQQLQIACSLASMKSVNELLFLVEYSLQIAKNHTGYDYRCMACHAGECDNEGFHLRGVTKSKAQGFYLIETILPGKYQNGALLRPSRIHFKITPPDYPTLTTQLYFESDTSIPLDPAASITSGKYDARPRIIPIVANGQGRWEGLWDIVIDGGGIVGSNNIHVDKGMVYEVSPNPFEQKLFIRYGVFQRANIALKVFNMKGQLISSLEERELTPEKYTAEWTPDYGTPEGHYFIVLQVNDVQVHAKVILTHQ